MVRVRAIRVVWKMKGTCQMTDAIADPQPDPQEAAIEWHIAMPSMDAGRWVAFTQWLEADPAHGAAYDAVALADLRLAAMRSVPVRQEAAQAGSYTARLLTGPFLRRFHGKPVWIGTAVASSLAAVLVVSTMQAGHRDGRFTVDTVAGSSRTVAMGDGSSVVLNGATRMAFNADEPRTARLEQGEALFTVRHDADKPFTVAVGRFQVQDVGTIFNVVRDRGKLSVAVAEGRVLFDPDGARLMLGAGDQIAVDERSNVVTRSRNDRVGGWQQGEMEFVDTPLDEVAAAIHRRAGADIIVAPPLSQVPFTGNIRITGAAGADARHLANLVGASVHRDGEKWLLSPGRDSR